MKYLNTFLLAIAAGMCIGIGGAVFLSTESKLAGSILFATGLYIICTHQLNLFTGKVGYLVVNKPAFLIDLVIIWLGNLLGTGLVAWGILCSRIGALYEKALPLCEVKSGDGMGSLFVLGIFCGLLMYAAVEGYKRCSNPILLLMCVAAFILCGFEHCIADMFYYWLAKAMTADAVLRLVVITLGNSLGGVLIPLMQVASKKKEG